MNILLTIFAKKKPSQMFDRVLNTSSTISCVVFGYSNKNLRQLDGTGRVSINFKCPYE